MIEGLDDYYHMKGLLLLLKDYPMSTKEELREHWMHKLRNDFPLWFPSNGESFDKMMEMLDILKQNNEVYHEAGMFKYKFMF